MPERTEMQTIVAVAAGGAIGATARWALARQLLADLTDGFPWVIFGVNVIGCFLIGVVSTRVARDSVAWAFIATGLLGGFTTMSSFAVHLNDLANDDRTGTAIVYALATLASGFLALFAAEAARGSVDDGPLGPEHIE